MAHNRRCLRLGETLYCPKCLACALWSFLMPSELNIVPFLCPYDFIMLGLYIKYYIYTYLFRYAFFQYVAVFIIKS